MSRVLQNKMVKRNKTCDGCEQQMPIVSEETAGAVWLMNKLQFGFLDGFGGVDINGILACMELFEVPKEDRPKMMETILVISKGCMNKGKENGKQQGHN